MRLQTAQSTAHGLHAKNAALALELRTAQQTTAQLGDTVQQLQLEACELRGNESTPGQRGTAELDQAQMKVNAACCALIAQQLLAFSHTTFRSEDAAQCLLPGACCLLTELILYSRKFFHTVLLIVLRRRMRNLSEKSRSYASGTSR